METTKFDIELLIREALENKNVHVTDIILKGSAKRSEGYVADITFFTVIITIDPGVKKNIEIAVKCSRNNLLEEYKNLYEREAYFYQNVSPELTKFQRDSNVNKVFYSIPKCHKVISNESVIAIIMENLRTNGYRLYDFKKPLTLEHIQLVLKELGKFHAVSFAFKEKRKESFEKLANNLDNVMLQFLEQSCTEAIQQGMDRACNIMKEMNELSLYEMCHIISKRDAAKVIFNLMKTKEPEFIVIHGDCWSNNFMYQYESEDHIRPSKVAILDWQNTTLHSPVMDLSNFIYFSCSKEQLEHFDELLDIYYTSFAALLTELGCNANKVFPYSTLQKHWKKYSMFGMFMVTTFLHAVLRDAEEVSDQNESETGTDFGVTVMKLSPEAEMEYRRRLLAAIDHCHKNSSVDIEMESL